MNYKKLIAGLCAITLIGGIMPSAVTANYSPITATAVDAEDETVVEGPITYTISQGEATVIGCDRKAEGEIVIPETINNCPVTAIKERSFINCNKVTSVVVPDSVTNIEKDVFKNCSSMTSVTLPDGLTIINEGLFYDCESLTEVNIPEGVTSIGYMSFYCCRALPSIKLPKSLTTIGRNSFYACESLSSIVIPNSVTTIGDYAFSASGLVTAVLPNGIKNIDTATFSFCTKLLSVVIPNSVETIGIEAFTGCYSLPSISIPDSVKTIKKSAFWKCQNLISMEIGEGVRKIDEYVLTGCTKLESLTILSKNCRLEDKSFIFYSVVDEDTGEDVSFHATIYGYEGSTAQEYAEENSLKFEALPEPAPSNTDVYGDVNGDGTVNSADASMILEFYAYTSTGGTITDMREWMTTVRE